MTASWPEILAFYAKPVAEILFITVMFYMLLLIIQGTRTAQVVKGLGIIVILFYLVKRFELESIDWLLSKIFAFSVIAFVVIFQSDLRRALARLGQNSIFGRSKKNLKWVEEIIKAAVMLSQKKTGSIIVIERSTGLKNYIETGVSVDADVSRELLITMFMGHAPLHDGAVIVRREKIAAALCILPLSQSPYLGRSVGTRHRAGLGITEETDALAVVVSEERGSISLMESGQIVRDMDEQSLRERLLEKLK